MIYLVSFLLLSLLSILLIGWILSAPGYTGPVTDHFDGRKFINPSGAQAGGIRDLLKWFREREQPSWQFREQTEVEAGPNASEKDLTVTFINHSSFLIQVEGRNILTDPVYSARTSPFSWAGPRRMRPPGIPADDLPFIDLVLLSHNHYDHLDTPTLTRIEKEFSPTFVVPLGVSAYLKRFGVKKVVELDWYGTARIHGISVICTPAQHFSGRGMFDRDRTLWAGYVLQAGRSSVYFAGDSGYHEPLFREVGDRLGPFHLSLIPIGAYVPKWFMSPIHMSPQEAVGVHKLVGSRCSVAMHYGTFPLADDAQDQAPEALKHAREHAGVKPEEFILLPEGKPFRPSVSE